MKLIDLLVKELPKRGGWPGMAAHAWSDSDGEIRFRNGGCKPDFYPAERVDPEDRIPSIMHEDDPRYIVTRSEYEAAFAKNDGWIEWGGGECPVERGAIVDVKHRDGEAFLNFIKALSGKAEAWNHGKIEHPGDIIAYRPHRDINTRANDDRLAQDLNECIGQEVAPAWNGTGLPPVGCECEAIHRSSDAWQQIIVVAVNGGAVFGFLAAGGTPCALPVEVYQFRPLRTEAEKAREKLAASLHIAAGASPIELNGIGRLYFKLADAIISGSVFGTTFKADK